MSGVAPYGWRNWKGRWVNPSLYARLVEAAGLAVEDDGWQEQDGVEDAPTPEEPAPESLTPGQKAAATRAANAAAKAAKAAKAELSPLGGGIVTSSADLEAEALADAGGLDLPDPVDEAAEALSDALAELGGEG